MAGLEVVLDCVDADAQADFWAAALGYERFGAAGQYRSIVPRAGRAGPKLILQQVAEPKTVKNRVHLDLVVPDIEGEAERLVALGAQRGVAVAEHGHRWIAMLDPEGNEFCVCEGGDVDVC